jgi:hypothetical protein
MKLARTKWVKCSLWGMRREKQSLRLSQNASGKLPSQNENEK